MAVTWYRRFRMEFHLGETPLPVPVLPPGYRWIRWTPGCLDRHAAVKFDSFRSEVDALVFPCLGVRSGCRRLMQELVCQDDFLPAVTWLITFQPHRRDEPIDCAAIQGLRRSRFYGSVQNVGVVPEHRGRGLGRALVARALRGFRDARVRRVYLEVTARNAAAVKLYRSLGFRLARTMFKAVKSERKALAFA